MAWYRPNPNDDGCNLDELVKDVANTPKKETDEARKKIKEASSFKEPSSSEKSTGCGSGLIGRYKTGDAI